MDNEPNLESQLTQEDSNPMLLPESLSQSNTQINYIMVVLDDVERQLQLLGELIMPDNNTNHELYRLVINMESNTSLIASVFRYYEIYDELFPAIISGPDANLVDYIIALDRLDESVKYFKCIAAVDEQKRVTKLYDIGRQKLIEKSDEFIMEYSNSILPEELLELCTSTPSISVDNYNMQVASMSAFRIIFDWFKEHGFQHGLIDSYATKRGTMICSSLELLANYLQQKSIRRASFNKPSACSHSSSGLPSYGGNTLREQVRTKIHKIGRRLVPSSMANSKESSSKNTLLLPPIMETQHDLLDIDDLSSSHVLSDDRETNNYKFLLDAFVVLLLRDLDLLFYAFSNEFQPLMFTKLIELPLVYMHGEAQELCVAIEQLSTKMDTGKLAFYGLFSVIRWFDKSKPILIKFYRECNLTSQHQFGDKLLVIFERSAIKCLSMVLDEVRSDSSTLSPGGNVHPLTSHVLSFMEGLLDYEDTINALQCCSVEENQTATNVASTSANNCLFNLNSYFADVFRALRANLLKKIGLYIPHHDTTIRAIFLLNNINYLLKRIESSTLFIMIEKFEVNLKSELETYIQKSLKAYMKCYLPIITAMQEMFNYDNSNNLSDNQLKECDRDQLKSNFLMVNAAIDTLRQQNQEYIVDDVQLRNHLRTESKKLVLDIFKTYYTKFAHKHFTHNPEKYIRYNPSMLEFIIDRFFEHSLRPST